ncbi:hypothetical protein KC960_02575 [Candidatus Saccharibacteria bacterium]|nr:hypothetical protein [Candidatus Saccharibacteria bacterium]
MRLKIASWNILNNHKVPVHLSQEERLDIIIKEVNSARGKSDRFILFLCECESVDNITKIASKTNLEVVGRPYQYRNHREEYFVFLADKRTSVNSSVRNIRLNSSKNDGILVLETTKLTLIGCHLPYRIVFNLLSRWRLILKILKLKPTAFFGDFNATTFFPIRLFIKIFGYKESHKLFRRPPFPSPIFRGKNIHWWLPNINIDAIYSKETTVINSGFSLNNGSDHPLIWSEFEI